MRHELNAKESKISFQLAQECRSRNDRRNAMSRVLRGQEAHQHLSPGVIVSDGLEKDWELVKATDWMDREDYPPQ